MGRKRTDNFLIVQTEFDDWHQVLTLEERIVIETKVRFFDWKEALVYCKARDAEMGKTKYFEILQTLDKKVKQMGNAIMKRKLLAHHIDRITTLEAINHNMWKDYNSETDHKKRADILEKIAKIQPLLSLYYADTTIVSEKQIEIEMKLLTLNKAKKKPKQLGLKNVKVTTKTEEDK